MLTNGEPIVEFPDDNCTGCWISRDNNHFIGLDFIHVYQKVDQKKKKNTVLRAKPHVYFVKRTTLLSLLQNNESKERCLNFI